MQNQTVSLRQSAGLWAAGRKRRYWPPGGLDCLGAEWGPSHRRPRGARPGLAPVPIRKPQWVAGCDWVHCTWTVLCSLTGCFPSLFPLPEEPADAEMYLEGLRSLT